MTPADLKAEIAYLSTERDGILAEDRPLSPVEIAIRNEQIERFLVEVKKGENERE